MTPGNVASVTVSFFFKENCSLRILRKQVRNQVIVRGSCKSIDFEDLLLQPVTNSSKLCLHSYFILFILFDLEITFLFPWAVVLDTLGLQGFIVMMIFLGILVVGFIYEWKKGALDWE